LSIFHKLATNTAGVYPRLYPRNWPQGALRGTRVYIRQYSWDYLYTEKPASEGYNLGNILEIRPWDKIKFHSVPNILKKFLANEIKSKNFSKGQKNTPKKFHFFFHKEIASGAQVFLPPTREALLLTIIIIIIIIIYTIEDGREEKKLSMGLNRIFMKSTRRKYLLPLLMFAFLEMAFEGITIYVWKREERQQFKVINTYVCAQCRDSKGEWIGRQFI